MLPGVLTSLGSSQTSSYYQGWGYWAEILPIAWCFLALSSVSCQLRTCQGNRQQNSTDGWRCACGSMVLLHSCLWFVACPPGPQYTRSISPLHLQVWQEGLGGSGFWN